MAQLPVSVFLDNIHKMTISIQGTEGKSITVEREIGMGFGRNHYAKLYYGANGIEISKITFRPLANN